MWRKIFYLLDSPFFHGLTLIICQLLQMKWATNDFYLNAKHQNTTKIAKVRAHWEYNCLWCIYLDAYNGERKRGLKLAPVRPDTIHNKERPPSRTMGKIDSLGRWEGIEMGVKVMP
jgi:hypothetical protein